jgi:acetoin utilization deacetylase AcuC-like enzyme
MDLSRAIAVIYSPEFLEHQTGRFHPERPERLNAIVDAIKAVSWATEISWELPTPADKRPLLPLLAQVHSPEHISLVRELAETGGGYLDADTPVSPRSYDVALLAVSAWLDGVDRVIESDRPAFVLARPPGHHAEKERGMGFCLFSNAAIAANYALQQPNIDKVAILDWDVHHGNGTQNIVETSPQIAYCSLHQSPCYPGTGRHNERGNYNNVLNLPIAPSSNGQVYQTLFIEQVIPFLTDFDPDLLIISAGYDANAADPLAGMCLQPADYGLFARYCLQVSDRLLFGLEGGYDLTALAESVLETLAACLSTTGSE